jgi:hypothetical protein
MSGTAESDVPADSVILGYTGVYDADGGLIGEARYVIGHLLGTADCALCDITHSPVRKKPEWDRMVARLGITVDLLHRNELDTRLSDAVRHVTLPVVLGHRADGTIAVVLSAAQLAEIGGSVDRFERALRSRHPSA